MDIRSLVRLSGQFMQTLCEYNVYVTPPRSESEKKCRFAKRRRRHKTLRQLQVQIRDTLQ